MTFDKNRAIQEQVKALNYYNEKYREGNSIISDSQFDMMEDDLRELDPNNDYFKKIGIKPTTRKAKLPVKMGSLNKVKSLKEIENWLKHKKLPLNTILCLSPKYDGCSLLVDESADRRTAFTRGDGIEGQHVGFNYEATNEKLHVRHIYSIGEAIIPKKCFQEKYTKEILGETDGYANARNMVSSLFNTSNPDTEKLKDVFFLRFGLKNKDLEHRENSKSFQIGQLNYLNRIIVPYKLISFQEVTEELINELYVDWSKDFEVDGIVFDIEESMLREKLGYESNGNPEFARAYKKDWEEIKETTIRTIDWQVGKSGKITPVAKVDPVVLEGGTVTSVTLYNAKYVIDNLIGQGTVIKLKRSGGVIPKIVEIVDRDPNITAYLKSEKFIQNEIDLAGFVWDENKVEWYLKEPNDEQKIQQLAYFFKTIGVEDFGIPTIRKFYESSWNTVGRIINSSIIELALIDGIGIISAKNLVEQFREKINNVSWAKLADASCCFNGLAEKTLELFEYNYLPFLNTEVEISAIQGIGPKSIESFKEGFIKFRKFCYENDLNIPKLRSKNNMVEILPYAGLVIVFTGIRDKELEEKITNGGGRVSTSVSKNTTHLVLKEVGKGSSKELQATELGIPKYDIETFKATFIKKNFEI